MDINFPTSLKTNLHGITAGLCLLLSISVQASDFSVQDMQGKTHSLAEHRGQWVLVNFWGTWCSPCLSEIPELNELQSAHQDLLIIGVAMQSGKKSEVANFVEAHHMAYPVVMGTHAIAEQIRLAAGQKEAIEVLPTSFLFNTKGGLVYVQSGELTRKTVEKFIKNKTN
ncbi:MAG: TlpA disulfide reductase family protein [Gallionella sp.]